MIQVLVWKFVALYVMGEAAHEFAMDASGADAPALAACSQNLCIPRFNRGLLYVKRIRGRSKSSGSDDNISITLAGVVPA